MLVLNRNHGGYFGNSKNIYPMPKIFFYKSVSPRIQLPDRLNACQWKKMLENGL